jgi:hypothetical protein
MSASLHIHWTGPMTEIKRESVGERWCFVCRKRTTFEYVVKCPMDPCSYYGANHDIECSRCLTSDSDLFPGREREWTD